LQDAINHAVGADNRPYVHLAVGSYGDNAGVNNQTIYLVGADGAIIAPPNGDGLGVMGNGSLTVRNLIVTAKGNGANCTGGKLAAYRTQFVSNMQSGIFSGTG